MRTAVTRSSDMVEAPPENNPGDTRTGYTVLSTRHRVQAGRQPKAANELSDDVVHDAAMHIGQPEVAAAVVIGQSLVIDAEQMEDRGVQIMNVDAIFNRMHAQLIGG